ncbi:MAG: PAS domain S-box protein [Ignavibacteriota bacterium]
MRTLFATFLQAAAVGMLCQVVKDLAFPDITRFQSQAVTVVLVGFAAAAAHFFVLRAQSAWMAQGDRRQQMRFYDSPLPMFVYNSKTLAFLDVNDAALVHYGYTREEFLALSLFDIRPPEDIPRLQEELMLPPVGFREAGAWRHRVKDGRIIWVQISRHSTDWNGTPAMLIVSQDITESKRNEEALRASGELFRTAFSEAP